MHTSKIEEWLKCLPPGAICPVVQFDPSRQQLLKMDFTQANTALTAEMIEDTGLFSRYVAAQLNNAGAVFGIGGYNEHRTVYSRSRVFDAPDGQEPRRVHLGVDIWGNAGTPVFAPLDGVVQGVAFNRSYGDYGATIILKHSFGGGVFFSLYGHLSLADIELLQEGDFIFAGREIAHFGIPEENGHWPPHLHFQLMYDLEGMQGDYPGVCALSKRAHYLSNCPDPDLLLGLMQYAH